MTDAKTLIAHPELLVPTPPMGWNSWNQFGAEVNETVARETADALVESGLRDLGYKYVVIDDLWHGGRDEHGRLYPHPQKFPSGMKALADYIHARGLKFGIYSDAGTKTCGGQPGSQDHEEQDARTFAEWGVDYLKYDFCYAPRDLASAKRLYGAMGRALRATGRPIVFSICEWGINRPWLWAPEVGGHLWRTTGDIADSWTDVPWSTTASALGIDTIGFTLQRGLEAYAGPGRWNDPDMLVVGLYGRSRQILGAGCTDAEYRAHFSLWCLLAAPLMIGCDVRHLSASAREILGNREVIAINQDPLGKQGWWVGGSGEVWVKPLQGGELAVGLFNRAPVRQQVAAHWSNLAITGRWHVRDLWAHSDLGVFENEFTAEVQPHGVVLLRLSPA